jgi:fructose-1,6-bisphosphatase I
MQIPENGKICSLNESYYQDFSKELQTYCAWIKEKDPSTNRPYSQRYIASMVADLHRNIIKGGIFIYPATNNTPNGKLRLLYECNPMAFIVEQAGGIATTGKQRVLDIQPTELHQRVPIIIGSKNMVEQALEILQPSLKNA